MSTCLDNFTTNCYIIEDSDTNKKAIVDPGGIAAELDKKINDSGPDDFEYIILTHGHFDHIRKVQRYKKFTGAKVIMNALETDFIYEPCLNLSCDFHPNAIEPFEVDVPLLDGQTFNLGKTQIKMLSTPGHTKGSSCFIADRLIFSGDTLMQGTIGRTDLKTGNIKDMFNSIKKIAGLSGDYTLYPGHGEITSLNSEREANSYMKKCSTKPV